MCSTPKTDAFLERLRAWNLATFRRMHSDAGDDAEELARAEEEACIECIAAEAANREAGR